MGVSLGPVARIYFIQTVGIILVSQVIVVSNLALGLWSWVGEVASIWIPPFSKFMGADAQKFGPQAVFCHWLD